MTGGYRLTIVERHRLIEHPRQEGAVRLLRIVLDCFPYSFSPIVHRYRHTRRSALRKPVVRCLKGSADMGASESEAEIAGHPTPEPPRAAASKNMSRRHCRHLWQKGVTTGALPSDAIFNNFNWLAMAEGVAIRLCFHTFPSVSKDIISH